GMDIMRPRFPLKFVEIAPLTPREIGPMIVTAYPALHTRETNPTECYFFQKAVRFHLNYPDLKAHWSELQAKRIVLTHMGPEMLAHAHLVVEECAYDGMVVPIG